MKHTLFNIERNIAITTEMNNVPEIFSVLCIYRQATTIPMLMLMRDTDIEAENSSKRLVDCVNPKEYPKYIFPKFNIC